MPPEMELILPLWACAYCKSAFYAALIAECSVTIIAAAILTRWVRLRIRARLVTVLPCVLFLLLLALAALNLLGNCAALIEHSRRHQGEGAPFW